MNQDFVNNYDPPYDPKTGRQPVKTVLTKDADWRAFNERPEIFRALAFYIKYRSTYDNFPTSPPSLLQLGHYVSALWTLHTLLNRKGEPLVVDRLMSHNFFRFNYPNWSESVTIIESIIASVSAKVGTRDQLYAAFDQNLEPYIQRIQMFAYVISKLGDKVPERAQSGKPVKTYIDDVINFYVATNPNENPPNFQGTRKRSSRKRRSVKKRL